MTRLALVSLAALVLAAPCAASGAAGWSGTVTYKRTASVTSGGTTATENATFSITLANGKGTGTGTIDFKRTDAYCGGVLTHEAHGSTTGPVSVVLQNTAHGKQYNVYADFSVKVTESKDSRGGSNCTIDRSTSTAKWGIGAKPALNVDGDIVNDSVAAGTLTHDLTNGCHSVAFESTAFTTCTDTLTWSLYQCNGGGVAKALREFQAAGDDFDLGDKQLQQAHDSLREWEKEEGIEFAKVGAEKLTILKTLQAIDAAKAGTIAGDVLTADFAEIAHVIASEGGPLFTGAWLLTDVAPTARAWDRDMKQVERDFAAGRKLAAKAKADLAASLSKGCAEEAKHAREKEDLADRVQSEIDKWELNGRNIYMDPITHDILDRAAAEKRASQILTGRRTQSAKPRTYTSAQLRAALTFIDKDIALHAPIIAGRDRADRLATALHDKLAPLVARLKT